MDVRAAVAFAPDKPLEVAIVKLEGCPTGTSRAYALERPGKVVDWLLPGWKFDVDYRSVQDRIDIVVTVI